jgi:phosphoribosylformimino-5-aminoimidazole carboxamide ribotide isomerase
MTLQVIPAIDFINERVVRLRQGKFDNIQYFDKSIFEYLDLFYAMKASRVHLINLESAKDSSKLNYDTLEKISEYARVPLQYGGGLKSLDSVQNVSHLFHKIIISSLLDSDFSSIEDLLRVVSPNKVIAALDVQITEGNIEKAQFMVQGWTKPSRHNFWSLLTFLVSLGVSDFIITDISKDGMMAGPNIDLYRTIRAKHLGINIYASGGVSSLDNLMELDTNDINFAIIGKALLTESINIKELEPFLPNA